MKKQMVFLLFLLFLTIAGCGNKEFSKDDNLKQNNGVESQKVKEKTVNREVYVINDKEVFCKGFVIGKNTKVRKMIKALGKWSGEYSAAGIFYFDYPSKSPLIEVNSDGFKKVTSIDISNIGTSKGLKHGDGYEKLLRLYGKPTRQGQHKTGEMYYYYDFKETLFVSVDETDRVNRIEIQYVKIEGIYF